MGDFRQSLRVYKCSDSQLLPESAVEVVEVYLAWPSLLSQFSDSATQGLPKIILSLRANLWDNYCHQMKTNYVGFNYL